ncbi:unnamed protein product [Oikopleura dioica]|uniref:Uncharacterized protein n=1 Tax=Oikopleura dioica TaxID=34765 RepID=E4Y3X7_OIKDI|nr:unnamed protein product [Oikopleura dioica]
MNSMQRLPRLIFVIVIILLITFLLGYFVFPTNEERLIEADDNHCDILSRLPEETSGKPIIKTDFLEIVIDGKVINAMLNNNQLRYNESKEFCASKNLTLPRTSFNVIEKGFVKKFIFWIADNEETRSAASEKNREYLNVSFSPNGKEFCAILVSEIHNLDVPFLYICEDEVFDDSGQLIWQQNFTVDCDLLKCNKTFIMDNKGGKMDAIRDHTDGTVGASRWLTGYQKATFSVEETGIGWCA